MNIIIFLAPVAVLMGLVGLLAFLWSLKSGQYDDLKGAAHRILIDDDE
jgi:cbb3-type cytochrome oxidase maturation protein